MKLVERLKAGRVPDVVGMERDAEEVAVRGHRLLRKGVRRAAEARHLAVHQVNVEVGKFDVVTLRSFVAPEQRIAALASPRRGWGSKEGAAVTNRPRFRS